MTSYYLDIETTGLDEVKDKIITIQWAELERNTGKLIGDIHILKEWESDEKTMLDQFMQQTNIVSSYDFDFIPVGYNLKFEHKFILEKLYFIEFNHIINPPYYLIFNFKSNLIS
ncbi:MAG: ribonuclease H-like domain-containing protein [Candidatus Nitrosoabyssus spongiisocia]|nr:MAG: ribonuclease H-like domain-containing protein [Nitrosopumilaceae archaeon AB1(1)]